MVHGQFICSRTRGTTLILCLFDQMADRATTSLAGNHRAACTGGPEHQCLDWLDVLQRMQVIPMLQKKLTGHLYLSARILQLATSTSMSRNRRISGCVRTCKPHRQPRDGSVARIVRGSFALSAYLLHHDKARGGSRRRILTRAGPRQGRIHGRNVRGSIDCQRGILGARSRKHLLTDALTGRRPHRAGN